MNTITEVSLRRSQESAPGPAVAAGAPTPPPKPKKPGHRPWRNFLFRFVRTLIAIALLCAAFLLARKNLLNPTSDVAFLNADIISLRAPVAGELELEATQPGALIEEGQPLFRVKNVRVANQQVLSEVNTLEERVDRLRTECAEAAITAETEIDILKHYRALYERKTVSEVVLLEHQQKVAVSETVHKSKLEQLRFAEERRAEMLRLAAVQNEAKVTMPFAGVVWAVREQNGSQIGEHEKVVDVVNPKRIWVDAYLSERLAEKFPVETQVIVRTVDGREQWKGRVTTVRAGVDRIGYEKFVVSGPPDNSARGRIAVRVELEPPNPFTASEFFGIGRSVVVSLDAL